MEHIFHFVMDHLTKNNIINKHQHDFRLEYSCQSQLLSLTEDSYLKRYGQQEASGPCVTRFRPSTKCPTNAHFVNLKTVEFKVTLLNG